MAKAGTSYEITLKQAHVSWGTTRYTGSRPARRGEAYLPIPSYVAHGEQLLNKNGTKGCDVRGKNLFVCNSRDGYLRDVMFRAQGNQGDRNFAKQFSADGDLRLLGDWYRHVQAGPGDRIRVTFTAPDAIMIEKI